MTIEIDKRQWAQLNKLFTELRAGATKAGDQAMLRLSKKFEDDIRTGYRTAPGATPPSTWTLLKRTQGKSKGKTPALRPRSPVSRGEQLAALVFTQTSRSARSSTRRVMIKSGRSIQPSRQKSDLVASIYEFGAIYTRTLSPEAQYYLRALMAGIAGTGQKLQGVGKLEHKTVTITIPRRPVWVPAVQALHAQQLTGAKGFATLFTQELQRALKLPFSIAFK